MPQNAGIDRVRKNFDANRAQRRSPWRPPLLTPGTGPIWFLAVDKSEFQAATEARDLSTEHKGAARLDWGPRQMKRPGDFRLWCGPTTALRQTIASDPAGASASTNVREPAFEVVLVEGGISRPAGSVATPSTSTFNSGVGQGSGDHDDNRDHEAEWTVVEGEAEGQSEGQKDGQGNDYPRHCSASLRNTGASYRRIGGRRRLRTHLSDVATLVPIRERVTCTI
jgi:hypothetical protein